MNIAKLLMTAKISQYRLAKEIGVSPQAVNQWLKGTTKPSKLALNALEQFAKKFAKKFDS